jgi:hypothetical protein
MGRFFLCDIKRIFSSRATIILCLIVPFAVMLLFASVVAPLLIERVRVQTTSFVVCDEDNTEVTKEFIDYVANSKAFKNLVYIYKVDTLEEGQHLIDTNQVSGMLHVPKNLYKDMSAGKNVTLGLYGNTYHTLECSLVLVAVETALNTVGRAQNALDAVRDYAVSFGAGEDDADKFYNTLLDLGIKVLADRKAMLGEEGFVSPAGEYVPAELYLSAMLAWFIALAALPLSSFSAGDFSEAVLQRGMRTGGLQIRFLTARLFSGAVFLLLVAFLVFPVGLGASSLDRIFSGSTPALFAAMGLMALSFSAMSLGLSVWTKNGDAAVWIGFWLIVLFAMAGGAILPDSMLPGWAKAVGLWSPVRAAMRLLGGAVFKFDAAAFWWDMLKIGLWGVFGTLCAVLGFRRRTAA